MRNDFYKLGGKLPVENKKAGARSGSEAPRWVTGWRGHCNDDGEQRGREVALVWDVQGFRHAGAVLMAQVQEDHQFLLCFF